MANRTRKNTNKRARKNAKNMNKGKSPRKTQRKNKNRKYKLLKIGGGCGCGAGDNSSTVKLWNGGDSTESKIQMYPYNDHTIDPNSPEMQVASRNMPNVVVGGKRRRRKTQKMRKMKGGDALLGANPNMPIMSVGTTSGSYDFYNIMNGTNQVNPAPYIQPVLQTYGDHNYPLV